MGGLPLNKFLVILNERVMKKFLIKEVDLVRKSTKDCIIDINIALAIDENYITPSGVLLFSILENNKSSNIHFHIFTTCCELDKFKERDSLIIGIRIQSSQCSFKILSGIPAVSLPKTSISSMP